MDKDIRYSSICNSYVVGDSYYWFFPFGRKFAFWLAKRRIKKLELINKDIDDLKRVSNG